MERAERKGLALRRSLASAERLSDKAIARGLPRVKTPRSRSSASLAWVTRWDHRLVLRAAPSRRPCALVRARVRALLRVLLLRTFSNLLAIAVLRTFPAANTPATAPFPLSTPWWNRIGRRQMGDGFILSCLPDHDLADDQAFANLDQVAVGQKIVVSRLAQEIDVEAGGHRQRFPSDRRKHRHIDRVVAQRHDGSARNRRAWAQVLLAEGLAEPAAAGPDLFNGKAAHAAPHLRKLRAQESRQFLGRERRYFHHVTSQRSSLGSSVGLVA